ncbi:hypothetical protein TraAM80_06506 [Trypanosoma rangeli]|uniref:Uncharacterized protein n=1 Tax=Trypanosoma rangeli TaxID=5698 RepID=A0A3R7KVN0_TRYRA|nr:uncharacterized protein TraAM80_06506 [Trypanosoma rangeli]RNF02275.1 hypothetical protein TraAM80_06506 [Trypanosoma rangeli]|eukprot:RNF02275.1 hypothetical protein TraAM80_06506 [Trypanosoma rangeli]
MNRTVRYNAASSDVRREEHQNHLEVCNQVIIVMRHGERRDGAVGAPSEVDPPLTKEGTAQITKTAEKIRDILGEKQAKRLLLIVSPFLRTRQTAQELQRCGIGDAHHSLVDNTLCEVYGPLRIKSSTAPVLPDALVKNGLGKLPQWGESIELASERYVENMLRNSLSYPQNNLLLVTHGDAISAIVTAVYPMRIVYETEYLSFIVLKRAPTSGCDGGMGLYQLIGSSGVQWLEEAPTNSLADTCTAEIGNTSSSGTLAPNATRPPNLASCRYGHEDSNAIAIDDDWDVATEGRNDFSGISLLFRFMLIMSQLLTLPSWSDQVSAVMYTGVVIAVELVSVALPLSVLHCVQLDVTLSSVERIHKLTRRQIMLPGCIIGPRLQRCTLSLCVSLVKAFVIFVLCMTVALLAGLFYKLKFIIVMRESYAEVFASATKFFVFALFVVFDTCRRFYNVEHWV